MGPLSGPRLGQNASLTLNKNMPIFTLSNKKMKIQILLSWTVCLKFLNFLKIIRFKWRINCWRVLAGSKKVKKEEKNFFIIIFLIFYFEIFRKKKPTYTSCLPEGKIFWPRGEPGHSCFCGIPEQHFEILLTSDILTHSFILRLIMNTIIECLKFVFNNLNAHK